MKQPTLPEIVDTLRAEFKRQYESMEGGLGWYTEYAPNGEFQYCAIDGNPDLSKLAEKIQELYRGK